MSIIQFKRGNYANLPVLQVGEPAFCSDTKQLFLGSSDGNIAYSRATNGNITYYVDAVNGNDSNNGLASGTAFQTISKALSKLPQIINHPVIINVASGTYNEDVVIQGFVGTSYIRLYGDTVVSSTRIAKSFKVQKCSVDVYIRGFACSTTTSPDCTVDKTAYTEISYMNLIVANANASVYCNSSPLYLHDCTISNKTVAVQAYINANIFAQHVAGSGNATALQATMNGVIGQDTNTVTGTSQQYSATGGVIR